MEERMKKLILIATIILLIGCNDKSTSIENEESATSSLKSIKQESQNNIVREPVKNTIKKVNVNWIDAGLYQTSGHLVKDKKSDLMWMRCAQGQQWDGITCQGEATKFGWEKSVENSSQYSDASGYNDWRLPTADELKTLIQCSNGNIPDFSGNDYVCGSGFDEPVISQEIFPNTVNYWYWTSTEKLSTWAESKKAIKKDMAVVIDFTDGGDGDFDKHNYYHSRLVRN